MRVVRVVPNVVSDAFVGSPDFHTDITDLEVPLGDGSRTSRIRRSGTLTIGTCGNGGRSRAAVPVALTLFRTSTGEELRAKELRAAPVVSPTGAARSCA